MTKLYLPAIVSTGLAVALCGCIDNNYDLSDIDTTTEIKVNNLTLPLNLDPVTLSDIIKVEEGDRIHEVTVNGKTFYAVEETGDYHSDPVKINTFKADPQHLSPTTAHFSLIGDLSGRKNRKGATTLPSLDYSLTSPVINTLHYNATGIDKSIHSVKNLGMTDLALTLTISLNQKEAFSKASVTNVRLELPKGLTVTRTTPEGSSYDKASGILSIPELSLTDGSGAIGIVADAISLEANGCDINYNTHSLDLTTAFNVRSATAHLTPILSSNFPHDIDFNIVYSLGDFRATSFTGKVEYKIDGNGLHIDPIQLNDLPDFLADENTNLILANPQIYLQINNPVGTSDLNYRSGMIIRSHHKDGTSREFPLDPFTVGHNLGDGPYNFCLSPKTPDNVPPEFAKDIQHVLYPDLGSILSGNGLPSSLDLELVNPEIYLQDAVDFQLGRTLAPMEGTYRFLAPLALEGDADSGSRIIYTDTQDGWNDEDVEALTIETLSLSTNVTSALPLSAKLTAHPIDTDGNIISTVSVKGADIPAGCKDLPITIEITGTVEHLDGVTFTAEVRADGTGEPLAPAQTITLKNIRATVSGKYTKEF